MGRLYAHDFASVPLDLGRTGSTTHVTVLKGSSFVDVSTEFLDDYGSGALDLFQESTWEQRARATLYTYRLSYRLRTALMRLRLRLSDAIYPREYRDD